MIQCLKLQLALRAPRRTCILANSAADKRASHFDGK